MIKKLNYVIPPVVSYFRHSYPLGILCTYEESSDWIVSNYMTLCWMKNQYSAFDMLVSYNDNPFLKLRTISASELEFLLSLNSLESIVKMMIDLEIYVQVNNDDYYLSTSRLYNKKHHLHQILITGYNDEINVYYCWTFVNGIYKEAEIPFDEIVVYHGEESYGTNTVIMLYSSRGGEFTLDTDIIFEQIRDYLESKIVVNAIKPYGCFDQYKGAIFGVDCYKRIYDELEKQYDNDYFDHRFLCVLSDHKKMLLERMKYLYSKKIVTCISDKNIETLDLIYRYSEVVVNNVIKINMIEKSDKKRRYYEKLLKTIELIESTERDELNTLLNSYERNKK